MTPLPRTRRGAGRSLVSLLVSLRPGQWTKNLIVFAGLLFSLKAVRAASDPDGDRSLRHLLRALRRRVSDQRRHGSRERSASSDQMPAADCGRRSTGFGRARRRRHHRSDRALRQRSCSAGVSAWSPPAMSALQALYSGPLKHIVIIDVLAIAIGFVLRAVAGAVVLDVVISHWLFVCTILLALFIALAKRRHELVLLADEATSHRPILGEYSAYLLDQMIAVVTASTLIAYIFYTISPETEQKFGTSWLGLTIPFPLYGIFRYLYLVHQREGGGSPADLLLNDRPLLACVTFWVLAVVLIIYHPFVP